MNRSIYLPAIGANVDWGISITAAGHGLVRRGDAYPLGGHPRDHALSWARGRVIDALQVVYIPQGEGEFETRLSGHQKIVAGSLFFLLPGIWHRYRPTPTVGWVEDWVELRGAIVNRLIRRRILDPRQPLIAIGDNEQLLERFHDCIELLQAKPAGFEAIAGAIGLKIVALAKSLANPRSSAEHGRIATAVSRGQTLISGRVEKRLRTGQIARELGVSESYFRRAFKAQTGLTPKRYHVELRLRKAQEMLAASSLTAKEIAARLGFDSPFHFSAHFKGKTGVSPSAWRKRR